jgi:signal transduction histidine kinase
LAIVHRAVAAHDGTITVDSLEGAGSRFTIRLPRVPATEKGR